MIYRTRAGQLSVKVMKKPFRLAFYDAGGSSLVREKTGLVNAGPGYADSRAHETMSLPDDEQPVEAPNTLTKYAITTRAWEVSRP